MSSSWATVTAMLASTLPLVGGPGLAYRAGTLAAQSGPPPSIVFMTGKIVSPSFLDVVADIVPGGSATSAFVRYGTTGAYGLTSARRSIAPAMTPVKVTWQLSGLHRLTTYHLQVVAVSAAGSTSSPDFTVPMPATAPGPQAPPPSAPAGAPPALEGNADQVRALPVATANAPFTVLDDVSCTTPTFCIGVGDTGSSVTHWRPLTEYFNGRAFTALASPAPWGAQLVGVACRTSGFCLAVGADGNNNFSERWDGKGWHVLATPSPRIAGGNLLVKVACATVVDCFSVGVENGGTKYALPLVEHWNGTSWSIVATPSVPAAVLESVSCPSPTSCYVVGMKDTSSGLGRPLIEHWDGRAFAVSPTPQVGGRLFSVACGGPTSCFAIGSAAGKSLLLELSGGSWHISSQLSFAVLDAAACASPSDCFAAGGVTAHWNGHAWALGSLPEASAAAVGRDQVALLQALSCPVSTECVGVGGLTRGGALGSERAIADVISTAGLSHG